MVEGHVGATPCGFKSRPRHLKKVLFFFISLVLVIGYILFAAATNYSYYLEANELTEKYINKKVKVSGVAFKIDKNGRDVKFFIQKNGKGVFVKYVGATPDAFGEGVPVVVEGIYKNDTIFAKTLLTKCPSKYESAER